MADQSVSTIGGFLVRWAKTVIEETVTKKSKEAKDTFIALGSLWNRLVDNVSGPISAVRFLAPYIPQAAHSVISSLPSVAMDRSRHLFVGSQSDSGSNEITAADEAPVRYVGSAAIG